MSDLRAALTAYLERHAESLLALTERHHLPRSDYTMAVRWLRRRRNPATRRAFRLPLRLRLVLAAAVQYEGRVLSERELARAALTGRREEGREEGDRISEKNKKKSRRAGSKGAKPT